MDIRFASVLCKKDELPFQWRGFFHCLTLNYRINRGQQTDIINFEGSVVLIFQQSRPIFTFSLMIESKNAFFSQNWAFLDILDFSKIENGSFFSKISLFYAFFDQFGIAMASKAFVCSSILGLHRRQHKSMTNNP